MKLEGVVMGVMSKDRVREGCARLLFGSGKMRAGTAAQCSFLETAATVKVQVRLCLMSARQAVMDAGWMFLLPRTSVLDQWREKKKEGEGNRGGS